MKYEKNSLEKMIMSYKPTGCDTIASVAKWSF